MKLPYALLLVLSVSAVPCAFAQATPAAPKDIYHIHFAKAAPGKAAALANFLKVQAPDATMKGHLLVLRHQEGDDWDYAVIEHMGTKATVEAGGPPPPPAARDLGAWHTDTFVVGPPWATFAKAMGTDQAGRTTGSVYVVGVFRVVPGHRDQAQKVLADPPGAGDKTSGSVVFQHLEGGPWQFLSISRYNSWQDFGTSESNSGAATNKGGGGWFELREHVAYHTDTIATRVTP